MNEPIRDNYGERIDASTVRFERILPGPLERVWEYLTDSDKRARWFCAGDTELEVGGRVNLDFDNASLSGDDDIEPPEKYSDVAGKVSFSGRVTRCEPPRLLAHTWEFGDEHSEVCYELEPVGDAVRLTLTHSRLGSRSEVLSVCGGWHTHLAILVALLSDAKPPPFWKTHTVLEADYERRIGA